MDTIDKLKLMAYGGSFRGMGGGRGFGGGGRGFGQNLFPIMLAPPIEDETERRKKHKRKGYIVAKRLKRCVNALLRGYRTGNPVHIEKYLTESHKHLKDLHSQYNGNRAVVVSNKKEEKEDPENFIQIKNPLTKKYHKIDRRTGRVVKVSSNKHENVKEIVLNQKSEA